MTTQTVFQVNRNNLSDTRLISSVIPSGESLKDGQVLLKVDSFSFTANNITYATMGDRMRYWDFFPADEGYGIIPVWGFAEVVETKCEGIEAGERFYGYLPMGTHLVVEPGRVSSAMFVDDAIHRKPLSSVYNQYLKCSSDPLYNKGTEALQMLLRPLFTTSFLLDDFYEDNDFFSAETALLTSASSKTALGMAFLLHRNRVSRNQNYEIVGLTSPGNVSFVEGLGCYDRVVAYDQVKTLDSSVACSSVDFAGNGTVLGNIHNHYGDQLKYSCLVGASHWDQRSGLPKDLAGPEPKLFFAPSQAEKRVSEWGGAGFQTRLGEVWSEFVSFVGGWIDVKTETGSEGLEKAYRQVLSGQSTPDKGLIISL
ncbi:MAG: DUF2855 family protein [Methyloligellaceae bacterium]